MYVHWYANDMEGNKIVLDLALPIQFTVFAYFLI